MKKILSVILSLCCIITHFIPAGAYYDALLNAYNDPTEDVTEFEAEDAEYSEGFSVVSDSEASGGKVLKTTMVDATAVLDVKFEKPVSNMVMYVTHKAKDGNSNLSYIFFEGMDGESLYATEHNKYVQSRVYYGDAYGEYKVHIKGVRPGHMIDKVVFKYNVRKTAAANLSGDFFAENPEADNPRLPEVKEGTPGSFFFEAEEGKFEDVTSQIGEDSDASRGLYWYSSASYPQSEAPVNSKPGSKFKFYVGEKGVYKLWIRYMTMGPSRKSTWFRIDNSEYYRHDKSTVEGWKWASGIDYNLDKGWHTLELCWRQAGQKIDCMILTNQTWFTPNGIGSLPGQPIVPDEKAIQQREFAISNTRLWVNNVRGRMDIPAKYYNNELLVPISNIANRLWLTEERNENSTVLIRGRQYVRFYTNKAEAIINGRVHKTVCLPEKVNSTYYIPLSAIEKAFGIDWEYDESTNNLYLFDDFKLEENAREAKEGEIILLPNRRKDINIKIPYNDPDVKVSIYARQVDRDKEGYDKQNFHDNFKNLMAAGTDYKYGGLQSGFYWSIEGWVKCPEPYYKDGAFYTRRSDMQMEVLHDVLVSIIKDGKEDLFIARNLDGVKWYYGPQTTEDFKINTGGELYADVTFENISYYIDYDLETVKSCDITYRKVGEADWKKVVDPMNDKKTGQFRGSIVKTDEGTEYEIKAVLYDEKGKKVDEKTTIAKTKTTDVPIAKTIKLSEIYDGKGSLELQNICGTEDGWIRIDCEGQEIKADTNTIEAVYISECQYLIFENAVVTGGGKHGINITNESSNVHIRNCDISGWGPGDGFFDSALGVYFIDGYIPNYFAGIKIYNAVKDILIERCYIHDANMKTNPWTSPAGLQVHPCGSCGIYAGAAGGIVIRYNDIVGSDQHRFNDCIEGSGNFSLTEASVCANSDIYGNMFIYTNDDVMELDGAQMNVRVYENRGEQTLCGISTASTTMGPAYIFNNLITNLGTEQDQMTGAMLKNGGGGPDGYIGRLFIFNNTLDSGVRGLSAPGGSYLAMLRNNIIASRSNNVTITESLAQTPGETNDLDYDLLYGSDATEGREPHGLVGLPDYVDMETHNFNLAEESLGIDQGGWIDGFSEHYVTDGKPDIGAFEKGGWLKTLPYRPIDIYADKIKVDIANKTKETITFHIGEVEDGKKYSIVKNNDFTWLKILSDKEGVLKSNTDITVTIEADMTGYDYADGNGMILFRTEDGYSVPITIYAFYPEK